MEDSLIVQSLLPCECFDTQPLIAIVIACSSEPMHTCLWHIWEGATAFQQPFDSGHSPVADANKQLSALDFELYILCTFPLFYFIVIVWAFIVKTRVAVRLSYTDFSRISVSP